MSIPKYNTLNISTIDKFLLVEMNRPKTFNSLNNELIDDLTNFFEIVNSLVLAKENDFRCILLKGSGGNFCSGLDLNDNPLFKAGEEFSEVTDIGNKAIRVGELIDKAQKSCTNIEKCILPVICFIEGYCIGGATSIITACDIRICTKNSKFTIREVDIGIAADMGVLQRMIKQTGNDSLFRDLVYTGRFFSSEEALNIGLVSKITDENGYSSALKLAKEISEKSPRVLYGLKKTLNYSRDHSVDESLEYQKIMNSSLLQSEDFINCVTAFLNKKKPILPKF